MSNIISDGTNSRHVPLQCPTWCQKGQRHAQDDSWWSHHADVGHAQDVEGDSVVVDVTDLHLWPETANPGDTAHDLGIGIDDRIYNLDQARKIHGLIGKALALLDEGSPPTVKPWMLDPATDRYEQRGPGVQHDDEGTAYELQIDRWTDSPAAPTISYSELRVLLCAFVNDHRNAGAPQIEVRADGVPKLTITAPDARRLGMALLRAAALIEGTDPDKLLQLAIRASQDGARLGEELRALANAQRRQVEREARQDELLKGAPRPRGQVGERGGPR